MNVTFEQALNSFDVLSKNQANNLLNLITTTEQLSALTYQKGQTRLKGIILVMLG